MPSIGQFHRYIKQNSKRIHDSEQVIAKEEANAERIGLPVDLEQKRRLIKSVELIARHKVEVMFARARVLEHQESLKKAEEQEKMPHQSAKPQLIAMRETTPQQFQDSNAAAQALAAIAEQLLTLDKEAHQLGDIMRHAERRSKVLMRSLA